MPLLLIFIACIPFCYEAINTGELASIEDAIERQRSNHNILIGYGYNEQTACYKKINANYYQADVIALGTSRVMQFKNDYFEGSFYNCGGAVGGNYDEYRNFLENLDYTPKCMVFCLDEWVFNDAWNQSCGDYSDFTELGYVERSKISMLKTIIEDWRAEKWTFESISTYPENIGFNGRIKDAGFMYDGSYFYGYIYRDITSSTDYMFKDTLERIEDGKSRFEWGDEVDEDTLQQLSNLLEYCSVNDIYVIGFMPPFANSIYQTMNDSGNYGYLEQIYPKCKEIFDRYGYELYDYMDGASLGVTDDYFIDGFHGSDVVYGYIVEDMIANNSRIIEYVDKDKLRDVLENAYSLISIIDPDNRI
jgi:hypothetical protein